jgi:predicted ATPase/DNA-binding CsgD family transcriptional regulator
VPLRQSLPVPLTSFIGRNHELAEVRRLLETTRLLTLTGPGGIGKTRVAVQVVQNANFEAIEFVDLAPLTDAALVPQAVAASLGVSEQPGYPVVAALIAALQSRNLLVILDNCEHLLAACASLADTLLQHCAQLTLLTTSREPLGVPGEVVWQVTPLTVPASGTPLQPERLVKCEAVRLFLERASAARAEFALHALNASAVVEICQRLDGIPLALELAAARVKVLSAEQIADHLADRFALLRNGPRQAPARHQALAATIDWSYALLNSDERRLFDRLSVFAGGWTLEAAQAIDGDGLPSICREQIVNRLTRLIDTSLVIMEERNGVARYRQLETLRAYGSHRLEASGESQSVQGRHAAIYLELAEALAPQADGPENANWLHKLDAEYDNLRAALGWLAAHDAARGLRLAVAIERYWYLRGFATEGCRWLEELLACVADRTALWATAAFALAGLFDLRRELVLANQYAAASLDIMIPAGDFFGASRAARFLGLRALETGDLERAKKLCKEGLALAERSTEWRAAVEVLCALGLLAIAEHDLPEARRCFEESMALGRANGFRAADVQCIARLGIVARLEGDYGRARALIEEGLALAEGFGHRPAACSYLNSLGNLARCEGNYTEARRLLMASLDLGQRDVWLPLVLQNAVGSLGVLAIAQNAYRKGIYLLAAIAAGGAAWGTAQVPELRHDIKAALETTRAALSDAAYAEAWAEGQRWSLDEAIKQVRAATSETDAPARLPRDATATGLPRTLTRREREVAALVAQGRSNRQIGEALVITEGTARVHVEHMLAKLGFHSRAQLAGWAVARGLPSA